LENYCSAVFLRGRLPLFRAKRLCFRSRLRTRIGEFFNCSQFSFREIGSDNIDAGPAPGLQYETFGPARLSEFVRVDFWKTTRLIASFTVLRSRPRDGAIVLVMVAAEASLCCRLRSSAVFLRGNPITFSSAAPRCGLARGDPVLWSAILQQYRLLMARMATRLSEFSHIRTFPTW
jgi:hypothetical protein